MNCKFELFWFRFFLGKNRVIAIALGRSKESECRENLHEVSKRLKGQCGIVFTDKPKSEVIRYPDCH
jgi:mRNA turnover protein 4